MISKRRGLVSLEALVNSGKLSEKDAWPYEKMVVDGLSYKELMLSELGAVVGELYCREEEAQALVKLSLKVDLSRMSVPEILWIEDSADIEPWHQQKYSESKSKVKFEEEAAEPHHPSLRERFHQDRKIKAYFKQVNHWADTKKILRIAYGI